MIINRQKPHVDLLQISINSYNTKMMIKITTTKHKMFAKPDQSTVLVLEAILSLSLSYYPNHGQSGLLAGMWVRLGG